MALDGIIIRALTRDFQQLVPAKINRIQAVSADEILFTIRSNRHNAKMLVSCHSSYNRINLTDNDYRSLDYPANFVMVLRKHIDGAIITKIEQVGLDRIISINLEVRDELHDYHNYHLYVELMGKYANLVLVDDQNKIIDAQKRIPPYENATRTIHPGAVYTLPKPHAEKQNPFSSDTFNHDESLVKQFHGFSPLLSDEVLYRCAYGESFKDIMQEIDQSQQLYLYPQAFHLIELKHLNAKPIIKELNAGLDHLYAHKEAQVRIKQQSGDIARLIKQELKKNRNKLVKLQATLDDANDLEKYAKYGDLLYAYSYQFPHHEKSVMLDDFETGTTITIPLDNKLSVKQNAKKYYQKYTKSKNAQIEVAKQIALTEQQIHYFENLNMQLSMADVNDAIEMREELFNKGYLRKKTINRGRKHKINKPHFITLVIDGINIYVGKNNIQNEYITFKLGKRDDTWLHVKDMHGAHVLINTASPSENVLRIAAMFAAYYSQAHASSSVPINYCPLRNIKKPNRAGSGFVTLSNYKTIYIDPDEAMIETYLKTYQK